MCLGVAAGPFRSLAVARRDGAERVRSSSASAGRLFCRCRTLSWWRSTMISRSFECPERTAKRANDTSNRYRMRQMGSRMEAHYGSSAHTAAFSGTHRTEGSNRGQKARERLASASLCCNLLAINQYKQPRHHARSSDQQR